MKNEQILSQARRVFEVEADAIKRLAERIDETHFIQAVEVLKNCQGKVIVTGIGKSGLIGRKISATLSSTGTPSLFLHPAESAHGDLGVVSSEDVVLAISYGGESEELNVLLQYCARKNIPVIAMTRDAQSSLGSSAKFFLDIGIEKEACPLGLAPTTSTAVTLAMGDALAVALMEAKEIQSEDFAEFHPGGKLGRRLILKVKDVMHSKEALPLVEKQTPMREVIFKMTQREVKGVAGVVDDQGFLIGIITDGDIRRRLEQSGDPLSETAEAMMSSQPKTIDQEELAEKALFVMEQFQIQNLFAVEMKEDLSTKGSRFKPVGLLHIQDLLRAKIR